MAEHNTIEIKANITGTSAGADGAEIVARGLDFDDSGDAKTSRVLKPDLAYVSAFGMTVGR